MIQEREKKKEMEKRKLEEKLEREKRRDERKKKLEEIWKNKKY